MRISKYLKMMALAIPIGLIASAANVHAFTHTMTEVGIATERISTTLGFVDERSTTERISVTCDAPIPVGSIVSFQLSNGAIFSNASALKLYRTNAPASPNLGALTVSNGGTTIEFDITTALIAGDVLYVAATPGGATYLGPTINIPANLAVGAQISVSVATNTGEVDVSTSIYKVFQQFVTDYLGGVRTISINQNLLSFVGGTVTESRTMAGKQISSNATPGDIQALNYGTTNVVYTLYGNMSGVASVNLVVSGTGTIIGTTAVIDTVNNTATITVPLTAVDGTPLPVLTDILVTVNGATALEERSFNLGIVIPAASGSDVVRSVTLVDPAAISGSLSGSTIGGKPNLVWTADGMQYVVTYVRNDPDSGITSAIRMENVTGADRNYWVLVNSQASGGGKWKMVLSTQPILAGNTKVLTASDIMTAATAVGVTLPTSGFAVRILVNEAASAQNFAIYATQALGSSYRSLQVLKSTISGATVYVE